MNETKEIGPVAVTVTKVSEIEYTVRVTGKRLKRFKGESAWMNTQRYANDELFKAAHEHGIRGHIPFVV